MNTWLQNIEPLIKRRSGPLTDELRRAPGAFGLGQLPTDLIPDATTTITCGFCSTGCRLTVHLKDGSPVNLTPDLDYPVNLGMACPKGWEALAPLRSTDRATSPLLRDRITGKTSPVDWNQAADTFVKRFRDLKERYGPESCAFLSTGQIATEEMALLGSVWKFGMGFVHCDSNTRQCMATSHVAYKQSFGFDAPPFTYADFEESDVLVFVGANPCIAHPIMWQRVMQNPHQPDIFVLDPRATETAQAATHHLALTPKSDLLLLYGIAHQLVLRGYVDRAFVDAHTTGADAFIQFVGQFPMERVVEETGLSEAQISLLAERIGTGKRVSLWWTMGVNQSHEGTRTAQAIINLALLTGNIGRPGTGANSITGQCNAMGSRLYANATSLIGGHDSGNPAHRSHVASVLEISETSIPTQPSLAYDQIIDGIRAGTIRGLWIIGTNPAHSWVAQQELCEVLGKLEFLVVQDMYTTTETAAIADLLLPAAGWGEKDGTLINSERRIGVIRQVSPAPGLALSDFRIFRLLGKAWGCGAWLNQWTSPEAAFGLLKQLSIGRPSDISGIEDYAAIEKAGGIQWPYAQSTAEPILPAQKERRLFEDGRFYHPDQRALFLFDLPEPPPERASAHYPFTLLTGRGTSAQWHTGTRTNKSAVLRALAPGDVYAELNPGDAKQLGIKNGSVVRITSARGEIRANAVLIHTIKPGHCFLPMHYPEVNRLTAPVFDKHSRQPSYKCIAVRLEPEAW